MTPTVKRIVFGAVAGLLALGLGAGAFVHAQDQTNPQPQRPFRGPGGPGRFGPGGGPPGMLPMLGREINLTDAQRDQIKAIADSHKDEWKAIFDRERTAREALNAAIMLLIATVGGAPAVVIPAMGLAGFLSGMIMPSRDMLVRAAAPPGAVGRAFGIVSVGLSTGGMIGPMLFGWIMDQGAPRWVFGATVVFMVLTVALALIGDRSPLGRRRIVVSAGP